MILPSAPLSNEETTNSSSSQLTISTGILHGEDTARNSFFQECNDQLEDQLELRNRSRDKFSVYLDENLLSNILLASTNSLDADDERSSSRDQTKSQPKKISTYSIDLSEELEEVKRDVRLSKPIVKLPKSIDQDPEFYAFSNRNRKLRNASDNVVQSLSNADKRLSTSSSASSGNLTKSGQVTNAILKYYEDILYSPETDDENDNSSPHKLKKSNALLNKYSKLRNNNSNNMRMYSNPFDYLGAPNSAELLAQHTLQLSAIEDLTSSLRLSVASLLSHASTVLTEELLTSNNSGSRSSSGTISTQILFRRSVTASEHPIISKSSSSKDRYSQKENSAFSKRYNRYSSNSSFHDLPKNMLSTIENLDSIPLRIVNSDKRLPQGQTERSLANINNIANSVNHQSLSSNESIIERISSSPVKNTTLEEAIRLLKEELGIPAELVSTPAYFDDFFPPSFNVVRRVSSASSKLTIDSFISADSFKSHTQQSLLSNILFGDESVIETNFKQNTTSPTSTIPVLRTFSASNSRLNSPVRIARLADSTIITSSSLHDDNSSYSERDIFDQTQSQSTNIEEEEVDIATLLEDITVPAITSIISQQNDFTTDHHSSVLLHRISQITTPPTASKASTIKRKTINSLHRPVPPSIKVDTVRLSQKEFTDTQLDIALDTINNHRHTILHEDKLHIKASGSVNDSDIEKDGMKIQHIDSNSLDSFDSLHNKFSDFYSYSRLLFLISICLLAPPLFFLIGIGPKGGISDYKLMRMVMNKQHRIQLFKGFIWDVDMSWLRLTCLVIGITEILAAGAGIGIGLGVGLTR